MRAVFCTTCKGRSNHIKKTLPKNLKDNQNPETRFVLLDYNSQDDLIPYLKENHQRDIDSGKLIVYSEKTVPTFQMAHAKNMAHRLGIIEGGDILVNLDADNYTGQDFDEYILNEFKKPNIFLWSGIVKGLGKRFRGTSGRIVVTKNAFLKTGGYDQKYDTWAPDDKDFTSRLVRIGYVPVETVKGYLEAVPHTDHLRFQEYPHVKDTILEYEETEFNRINNSSSTIVNFGDVGCGTVYKNFGQQEVELKPIPTRIFGIGMHKTATTSLSSALKILGFESAHWDTPRQAKTIYEEVILGRSKTVEQFYTLSDLPTPLIYKELDILYPGSKFILTLRDEKDWLRSVKNHWNTGQNRWKETWDQDCFTHRIHQLIYGRKTFDPTVFLSRYRNHLKEICDYFKNRPDDLLIMIDHSWNKLCPFLDQTIPSAPYPKELVTCY